VILTQAFTKIRKIRQISKTKQSQQVLVATSRETNPERREPLRPIAYAQHGVRILFIADTHGFFAKEEIQQLQTCTADAIILLGDHGAEKFAVEDIIGDRIPMYGILGNHDRFSAYSPENDIRYIRHIGGAVTNIGGLRIAAFDGSFRYKQSPEYCQYTQEEMRAIAAGLPPADICIAHADAWDGEPLRGECHDGMMGITEYIERHHIPVFIHGHIHETSEKILRSGCRDICLHRLCELTL